MKLRPRSKASETQVMKAKLRLPLKTPKGKPRTRINRRSLSVKSERYQDPGPSNLRRSRRIQAQVSNWNSSSSELDRQCFVAVKKLTLPEIEKMKQNVRKRRDNGRSPSQPEKKPKLCPTPSSPIETGSSGIGITQLPEEVLNHILGFVTFADLKSARLVNKQWRKVATTPLRRSSKPISVDQTVFKCVTEMGDGQFPVNRLAVQLYDDTKKTKGCSSYFSGICAWVKELTLKMHMDIYIYENDMSRIREDMGAFPRDCTYHDLTHFNLQLVERTPRTQEFWEGFIDFVQSILKNSPNLREVNVHYWNWKIKKLPLSPVIEDLFPNGSSKLSYINFHDVCLEKIDFHKWSTLNLKLRKLGINLSSSSDLNDLLTKFLETQTGTLKELYLYLYHCDSKLPASTFTFPRMEKLEQFVFKSRFVSVTFVNFPGIDYVRMFPCLKKLDLVERGIDWKDFLGNNILEPTKTVEELIFPEDLGKNANPKPCPVVAASRIFPCLKKLEIYANPIVTAAVCENMPNLEVFIVNGYWKQLDDLITGLSLEVCEKFEGVMTKTWIEKLKTVERRSMARLENLKTLKLTNYNNRLICFSQLSFHVLKQMSSLKCLDLFDGKVKQTHTEDEEGKQLLEELRARFVVL